MKQKNWLIALIFLSLFQPIHSFDDFDLVGFDGECLPDGTGVKEAVSAVEVLIDAVSAFEAGVCSCIETTTVFSACNAQPITTATTISNPGTYCIDDTISGNISITASNVMLDLNGYTIQGSITVASNVQRVTIANGSVDAQGAMDGIAVESGTSLITIDYVRIKNALRGLSFTQSHENQVRHCTFTQNTTGMLLDNATEILVFDSTALENVHAGFDLISSSTNCFIDCKALATGRNNSDVFDATIVGFVSHNGYGNVFERCIANATQALSTTDFDSLVAGFALRGSEQCTKIIDSESANAIASSEGVTVPYGMVVELTTTQNVIKNNLVYCNQHDVMGTTTGIGISGSSSSNLIIGNVAYNNTQNYEFVTNVFNPLFQNAPSDLQNISLNGCEPIAMPHDQALTAQQIIYKIKNISQTTTSLIEEIVNKIDQLDACDATAVTNANTTITQEGRYCVAEPITGTITIAASNVDLDLNGYRIAQGIVVSGAQNSVTIKNGTVENDAASDGISVDPGLSEITISNVTIEGAQRGLYFNSVSNCQVNHCSLVQNTTGMQLEDSYGVVVQNTYAGQNIHAGFDLIDSSTNCFIDCKAVSTGLDNQEVTNNNVAGFISTNGYGNIFERCVANATQALSTTDLASVVAGFALRGTEKCSKIIDSESGNAIASSDGVTVPKGIFLEDRFDMLVTQTMEDIGFTVNTLDWSSDGIFLASGSVSGPNELRIYEYDRQAQVLKLRASADATLAVLSVKWSPSGQYIAVGMDATGATAGQLIIFAFDRTTFSLKQVAQVTTGVDLVVNSVDWSFDEQYVAFGVAENVAGDEVFVYKFDRVNNTLTFAASTPVDPTLDVTSVNWSHDGQFLAVTTFDLAIASEVLIFQFNRAVPNLTEVASQSFIVGIGVNAARWSSSDLFLAVGTTGGFIDQTQIYRFNKQTFNLNLVASNNLGIITITVNGLSWAPNEEYLAVVSTFIINEDQVHILHFDKDASLEKVGGASLGVVALSVDWSPDGQLIAVSDTILNQQIIVYQGLLFPTKNIVQHNVVYSSKAQQGMGISGSSIANALIDNVSYNNKADDIGSIFFNYVFSTNVFNPLFQNAPSALQNISLDGCDPIAQPLDQVLIAKQIRYKLCSVESALEEIISFSFSDIIAQATLCSPTNISSAQTISQSGTYRCCQNITGDITIAASDVVLDLNNYKITGGIIVNSNLDQITLKNGVVENGSNGDGILINSGATNITIENITVKNTTRGIHFDTVVNGLIDNVTLVENTTGLQLENSYNISVFDATAKSNLQAGYELLNSTTCCILDSKALSTGLNNTELFGDESNVFGFVLNQSYGNIIERCIANATQNLSATSYDTVVAGFALLGTGTQCNKIIGCEAANATASDDGGTTPYGIFLEGIINIPMPLFTSPSPSFNSAALTLDWSPDGKFLAIAGDVTGGLGLRVYRFDLIALQNLQQFIPTILPGSIVRSVNWSPDGKFLAVGTDSGTQVRIYRFDPITPSLQQVVTATPGNSPRSVDWSPDGMFLAVGSTNTPFIRVYRFDPIAQTLELLAAPDVIPGAQTYLNWSPDGRFLGTGSTNASIRVYRFDPLASTPLQQVTTQTSPFSSGVFSINWSPDGIFLAIGELTAPRVSVLYFDSIASSLSLVVSVPNDGTSTPAGAAQTMNWSPDGRFLAVGFESTSGAGPLRVYRFDPTVPSLFQITTPSPVPTGNVRGVSWSPDGRFLAIGALAADTLDARVYSVLDFSSENIIINNTVYCNGHIWTTFNGTTGAGISGSSIANCIIQNNSYNNPFNYVFVTNEFNQLFGIGPSLVQNIGIDACEVITTPQSLAKKMRRAELLLESLIDNLL